MLSLARWRPSHLFGAWAAYWVGLAAVTLTPLALAIVRATTAGGTASSVSASFGDGAFHVAVTEAGRQTFAAAAHALPVGLWIAVPPLALFGAWVFARTRAIRDARVQAIANPAPDFPVPPMGDRSRSAPSVRTPSSSL